MAKIISILFLAASLFTACNDNNKTAKENSANTDTIAASTTSTNSNTQNNSGAIDNVVTGYLNLKDALANDNGNEAAVAAKEMGAALVKVDESGLTPEQKKVYADVKDDIKEHAEHIGTNASNIKHQREHFDILSQDMIDLVKATGSPKTLYEQFCPMYNNKKGASWLSQTKDIKNPYYGKEMPDCGEVKEEIKAKG